MDFTDEQIERYARHIVLKEVGGAGQQRLLRSKVLVVGAGGLGCPVTLYLAAAGVGTIGVVDDDVVSLSNLQRQIAHATARIGMAKTASAAASVAAINPDVRVTEHRARLAADNALELVGAYDLVADGSDNFATRFLVNDACFLAKKTLVTAAIAQFDGQIATFKAYEPGDHPCYRCLFREAPQGEFDEACARDGVLGALAGRHGLAPSGRGAEGAARHRPVAVGLAHDLRRPGRPLPSRVGAPRSRLSAVRRQPYDPRSVRSPAASAASSARRGNMTHSCRLLCARTGSSAA